MLTKSVSCRVKGVGINRVETASFFIDSIVDYIALVSGCKSSTEICE